MIAVNEEWVIALIEGYIQNGMHDFLGDCNFLSSFHVNDEVLDTVSFEEWLELRWIFFIDKGAI